MGHRVKLERTQLGLVNERMDWAGFLRRVANEGAYEVLQIAALPLATCIELVRNRLGLS
jgi:hypothetical protein